MKAMMPLMVSDADDPDVELTPVDVIHVTEIPHGLYYLAFTEIASLYFSGSEVMRAPVMAGRVDCRAAMGGNDQTLLAVNLAT